MEAVEHYNPEAAVQAVIVSVQLFQLVPVILIKLLLELVDQNGVQVLNKDPVIQVEKFLHLTLVG